MSLKFFYTFTTILLIYDLTESTSWYMRRIKVFSQHNWYKCSNHFLKVDIKSLRLYQDSLHTIHCPPQPTKTFHDIISCSVIEFNVNLCRLWYCMILIHGYLLQKHAARMYFATTLVLIVLYIVKSIFSRLLVGYEWFFIMTANTI